MNTIFWTYGGAGLEATVRVYSWGWHIEGWINRKDHVGIRYEKELTTPFPGAAEAQRIVERIVVKLSALELE